MCVILGEATNTKEAMEDAGKLVAMNKSKLGSPDGKLAIGGSSFTKNKTPARAIHRFDGEIAFVNFGEIHVFAEVVPMTGAVPKF